MYILLNLYKHGENNIESFSLFRCFVSLQYCCSSMKHYDNGVLQYYFGRGNSTKG